MPGNILLAAREKLLVFVATTIVLGYNVAISSCFMVSDSPFDLLLLTSRLKRRSVALKHKVGLCKFSLT